MLRGGIECSPPADKGLMDNAVSRVTFVTENCQKNSKIYNNDNFSALPDDVKTDV